MKSFIANIINLFILFTFIAISVQAKELNDKELRCLALNIYHEARSEPPVGRYAVAWVTLNRVEHEKFRNTVCKVVYQPGQFSWTEDGKSDKTYEKEAYKEAMKIAEDVYYAKEEGKIDPTGGATFYRNRLNKLQTKVNPETGKLYTKKEAEAVAFNDFYKVSEETQQSSRTDRISMQQASGLGRVVLNYANTPMQYARIIKKATKDLLAGRGDWRSNVSKIIYYGACNVCLCNKSMAFKKRERLVFV